MEKPTYEDLFEKEFDLSEKMWDIYHMGNKEITKRRKLDVSCEAIPIEDIKEFIKRLKEEVEIIAIHNGIVFPMGIEKINNKIDELAGDKLC